jgi:uncharacterized repeat protein (TIGR03803 family)
MHAGQPIAEGKSLSQLSRWKTTGAVIFLCAACIAASAQTVTNLVSFDQTDGMWPLGPLVQGADGNFYGTTFGGGLKSQVCGNNNGCGTIFRMTPSGTLTTLYEFCAQANCPDGAGPRGLLLATDGNFYGVASNGGYSATPCLPQQCGTVFRITPDGTFTTLHKFTGEDGAFPYGSLIQDNYGNLYGTTQSGGTNQSDYCLQAGCGTVFRLTLAGVFTRVYNFCSQTGCTDGGWPVGGVIQASDGNLYGTTQFGGTQCSPGGCGTVFRLTRAGSLTTLHSFAGAPDGYAPYAGLLQAADGLFYGTTSAGGDTTIGRCHIISGCGTVFRIGPGGTLLTLFRFCTTADCPDASSPEDSLVQGTDGNFYFTAAGNGGEYPLPGAVFREPPVGQGPITLLYGFGAPISSRGLVQGTDGEFYGTTTYGGTNGYGSIYSLDVGLGPFVKTLVNSGIVGANVAILGTDLSGTTGVTFNGAAATFTVVSGSEIIATIPAGATTGEIAVTTPSGVLSSNVAFRVTPQILSFSPTSGAVGTSVTITGQSLSGARALSFGGVLAVSFKVNSYTQITATVPNGAKTGVIGIQTAGGGYGQSTASFTVTP